MLYFVGQSDSAPFRNAFESPLTFERIVDWLLFPAQPQIVGSLYPYIATICANTFGGSSLLVGDFDVLPAKQVGINGPCPWTNHGQRGAENCQNTGHPWIASTREHDPEFDKRNRRSGDWSP